MTLTRVSHLAYNVDHNPTMSEYISLLGDTWKDERENETDEDRWRRLLSAKIEKKKEEREKERNEERKSVGKR